MDWNELVPQIAQVYKDIEVLKPENMTREQAWVLSYFEPRVAHCVRYNNLQEMLTRLTEVQMTVEKIKTQGKQDINVYEED